MGTNYYLHENAPCEACGHQEEPLHIGKSSAGWCFSLHIIPELGIHDLPDWQERWSRPGAQILNEYGETIPPEKLLATITQRKWNGPCAAENAQWAHMNHAEPGPEGLSRHLVGRFCSGHGDGTYDLIPGEFS